MEMVGRFCFAYLIDFCPSTALLHFATTEAYAGRSFGELKSDAPPHAGHHRLTALSRQLLKAISHLGQWHRAKRPPSLAGAFGRPTRCTVPPALIPAANISHTLQSEYSLLPAQ